MKVLLSCVLLLAASSQAAPGIDVLFVAWRDVEFHLYTRSNPTSAQNLILHDSASIKNSNFKNTRQTRYIIHGFQNNGKDDVNIKIRDAYLQKADVNVIVIDWGKGASTINYNEAKARINDVASIVAEFIEIMAREFGQSLSAITLVGHSLGAHTCGLTAKKLKSLGTVPRIVGLDPAMPGFSIGDPSVRLAASDATFVFIIHTNCRMLGFDYPLGHVDYYPNYGTFYFFYPNFNLVHFVFIQLKSNLIGFLQHCQSCLI